MAVRLILKNSVQEDKRPTTGDIDRGEVALNLNANGPFLCCEDSDGTIQQIAGVKIAGSAPANPVRGTQWLDSSDTSNYILYLYSGTEWLKVAEGESTSIIAGDGIASSESGGVYTLSFDYDANKGLGIENDKAVVKLKSGGGLVFDSGEITVDDSDLDGRYVKLNGNTTAQTITGTGGLKAEGSIESSRGLVVGSAGSTANCKNGMLGNQTDDGVRLVANSQVKFSITKNVNIKNEGSSVGCYLLSSAAPVDTSGDNTFGFRSLPRLDGQPSTNTYTHYVAESGSGENGINAGLVGSGDQVGFQVSGSITAGSTGTTTGFRSLVKGSDNYNLFVSGDSPNFLISNTYIGGSTGRNTLQTWLSTLTEEQREEYDAGTFAAPADVTTPGDGTWMRQWWYNQQTPEVQAEIDAGTLDYPEWLQPANFVDNFTLGETTKLNLLNNGQIVLKGNNLSDSIKNTLGDIYPAVGDSVIGRQQDGINIASGGYSVARLMSSGSVFPFAGATGNANGYHLCALGKIGQDYVDTVNGDSGSGSMAIFAMAPDVEALVDYTGTKISFVNAATPPVGYSTPKEFASVWGFNCANLMEAVDGGQKIGYRSDIRTATDKQNFNFYATGDAPNYFASNVGIGTDEPERLLTVQSNSSVTNQIVTSFVAPKAEGCGIGFVNKDTAADNLVTIRSVGNDLALSAGGTYRFYIKSDGLCGIGTDDPQEKLDVNGKVKADNVTVRIAPEDPNNYTATTDAEGNQSSVYSGPTLDVKETLLALTGALESLKTAAASATTCEELRGAIETALANI